MRPPLKKNVSAFLHFCAEQREAVKAENPEITGKAGEITKILGQRWKALDGDAKARYNEMAAADKRRYDAEKKERGGDVPKPAKKDAEPHETIIPVARVKKICVSRPRSEVDGQGGDGGHGQGRRDLRAEPGRGDARRRLDTNFKGGPRRRRPSATGRTSLF